MTLALPEKTWTVFYATSGSETVWYFFIDESAADSFYEKIRRAGYYPTKRPYHPTDAKHMTQEQAELLHAAADSVPRLTASAEPDYFPGKPNADHVLVMRARIAAGCEWDGYSGHGDQEPEVRRILRICASRLEELARKNDELEAALLALVDVEVG